MKETIFNELFKGFEYLVNIYPNLRFECEHSDKYGWRVVYYPTLELENDLSFFHDILKFEDELNESFGIEAPLFSQNNELFRLSDNKITYPDFLSFENSEIQDYSWDNCNVFYSNENKEIPLAA